jgi:protoporphyrinogen oxidase
VPPSSVDDAGCSVDVLVIGAGPTGLSAADALVRGGRSVAIVECTAHIGGLARTAIVAGQEVDLGGHRLLAATDRQRRSWLELAQRLGGVELCDVGRRSGILRDGYVVRYPFDWAEFRRTAPWRIRARSAASVLAQRLKGPAEGDDLSLGAWVTHRYGQYLAARYMHPHARKIFGVDPNDIPARWAAQRIASPRIGSILATVLPAPPLATVSNKMTDGFLYPRGGLTALWSGFADVIGSRARWLFNSHVESIARPRSGRIRVVVSSSGGQSVVSCRRIIWTGRPEDLASCIGLGALSESISVQSRRRDLVVGVVRLREIPKAWEGFQWVYTHDSGVRAHRFHNYDQWQCLRCAKGILGLEYSVDSGDCFDAHPHVGADMSMLLRNVPFDFLGSTMVKDAYSNFDATVAELALLDHALRDFGPGIVSTGRQGAGVYINLNQALELGAHVAEEPDSRSGVVGQREYSNYQEKVS